MTAPTLDDLVMVEQFRNFLSWGVSPANADGGGRPAVPPAWYAYALGFTLWCPPVDEL